MNSKYFHKNTKISQVIHNYSGEGENETSHPDLFAEINFKGFDYLVITELFYGNTVQFNFGTEGVKVSKYPWVKDRFYVEHSWAFRVPINYEQGVNLTKKDVLEELLRVKTKEVRFEDSLFYEYYLKDVTTKGKKEVVRARVTSLESKLSEFNN